MTDEQMRMADERVAELEALATSLREKLDALNASSWNRAILQGRMDAIERARPAHPFSTGGGRMI